VRIPGVASLHGRSVRGERGAASVEQVALVALVSLLIIAAVAALAASPPQRSARELGGVIANRIACAPRHPVPCGRNPLALAYGSPLGKLVRRLVPEVMATRGPGGVALMPVDFRRCRRASCAAPGSDAGLTDAGRRVTLFTSVEDLRRSGGQVRISYWLYRPTLGWERITRSAGSGEIEAASRIRLNLEDDPALVPLETVPGRNHYLFPKAEEPPWRWVVPSRYAD
jgi:hypothetical protein